MEIVSVHIEELARVTGRGEGFNLWGRITFTVRDSDADVRPFRLHVEVDVPIDPAAPLLALERALLVRALQLLDGRIALAPDAAERLYAESLAGLR